MKINNSFFDNKKFKLFHEKRIMELKKLSYPKAIKLQKEILLFFEPYRKNYSKDRPVSYEILLRKRNESY